MTDELSVEVSRLREASRFTATEAEAIRDRLRRLDTTISEELLADGSHGVTASAYDESWIEWKAEAEKIASALEASSASLNDARFELATGITRRPETEPRMRFVHLTSRWTRPRRAGGEVFEHR